MFVQKSCVYIVYLAKKQYFTASFMLIMTNY